MELILKQGRFVFAIAILALGIEHIIGARFGQPVFAGEVVIPVIPFVPARPVLGYLIGVAFIATGIGMMTQRRGREASMFLGILLLLCTLVLDVPRFVTTPSSVNVRTVFFETLSLCACALTLAGTLPAGGSGSDGWARIEDGLIKSGSFLFAISSIVFGIDHFLYLRFIAALIPSWIPGAMFWSVVTGAGFVIAGICFATKWMTRWAGALLGLMFMLWFFLLHAPRVLSGQGLHNPDEWSSALIALAMWGGSWIHAVRQVPSKTRESEKVKSSVALAGERMPSR